ncbi:MAG: Holliday junction branch migration DNA helicase RuvB [Acidobacteria bacterium]|nr:Holliday junction branch migration DNA helicase RuvB [Acidobacteriota bacterium]
MKEKLYTPPVDEEREFEEGLRPRRLTEYVGQTKIVENLRVYIQAARMRGEHLDHALFFGPPGLGKTTLAYIMAEEMGVPLKCTTGPALEKTGDLAAILTNVEERSILFIDEIHRLNTSVEELLYPALEDFHLDIIIGSGPSARDVRLNLKKFTLVGATTRLSLLTSPLRSRFGIVERLDYYNAAELALIIERSARILGIGVDEGGAEEISIRSRGTPRVANRLLRRVRDFAMVNGSGSIDRKAALEALERLGIDRNGFDEVDLKILETVVKTFGGQPVGLKSIAVAVGENADTIEDVYEPYLIQNGFLSRTPRGRIGTDKAFTYFNVRPLRGQPGLFE